MDFDGILKYKKAEEKNYYDLLGCDELSSVEQIICEFKLRSLKCHPDKNNGDPDSVLCFKKLLRAKEVLSDPETRSFYDKWLKSGLSMPFEQFLNLNRACHTISYRMDITAVQNTMDGIYNSGSNDIIISDNDGYICIKRTLDVKNGRRKYDYIFSTCFHLCYGVIKSFKSIHWACKKKKEAMLEYPCEKEFNMNMGGNQTFQENKDEISQNKHMWERDSGSELLRRFRNYEV